MQNKVLGKTIIVTGASSGIGAQLVENIAQNGGTPIMLARSTNKLQELADRIKDLYQIEASFYTVDLLNSNEMKEVINDILHHHDQVHGLVNNAGMGVFDYVRDIDWKDVNQMFQLNVIALMQMTKLVIPHFIKMEEGHLINISSQAGKIATPKSSVYAATKHAVLGFSNAIRHEIATDSIHVTTVNLGPVKTNFFDRADPSGMYQKNVQKYMLEPEKVAKKIVRNMFTNKREINMPWWMEMGSKLNYVFPRTMEKLLKKQFEKK